METPMQPDGWIQRRSTLDKGKKIVISRNVGSTILKQFQRLQSTAWRFGIAQGLDQEFRALAQQDPGTGASAIDLRYPVTTASPLLPLVLQIVDLFHRLSEKGFR